MQTTSLAARQEFWGYLNEPHDVVGVQLVLADPGGQDVPLHALAAVDADAQLRVLVLAGLW